MARIQPVLLTGFLLASRALAGQVVMDGSKTLTLQSIPSTVTSASVAAIILSADAPFPLLPHPKEFLCLELSSSQSQPPLLICRGAALSSKNSDAESASISICSITTTALVMVGISRGDVESGLKNSRHGLTLTAVFRARELESKGSTFKQTLLLYVDRGFPGNLVGEIQEDVVSLFSAAAAESGGSFSPFSKLYDLQVVSLETQSAKDLSTAAFRAARMVERKSEVVGLASTLRAANARLQEFDEVTSAGRGLDVPLTAGAFVSLGNSRSRHSRLANTKFAFWRSRVGRGLVVDSFGEEAESLRLRTLSCFEAETLWVSGLPHVVAICRSELQEQIKRSIDSSIRELFYMQVANLAKVTLKRLKYELLQNLHMKFGGEGVLDVDAAVRHLILSFEASMEGLEMPLLGLSKEKAVREMTAKLNDELMAFPDSADAKLERTKRVREAVSKERSSSQSAVDIGLDFVAVLRPDGFGSLQGYAGYQVGGNCLTFGVHNDADDPQVITQLGGVRPPLLRVQPKLRVDVQF